jgi:RNA polymerase sigma-70 factor (ECF subfamily)
MGVDSEARWRALMSAGQAGDGVAYGMLLRDCVPLIRAVAAGVGVPPPGLDDVVQEVLLAVHHARHTYDPAYPFTPWLRTIAQRRAIDALRSIGRRRDRELHAPVDYENHPDPAPGAALDVERADDGRRLRAAVAGLPAGQRQAVELLGLQELSLDEAARRTGRTKVALKVNLHRALKALRERMGDRG